MAKKGAREIVAMICEVCKSANYTTERNKVNMQNSNKAMPKLVLKKFCKFCKKVTSHKESSKLK
jgi:large subunit ribosomal protein L33